MSPEKGKRFKFELNGTTYIIEIKGNDIKLLPDKSTSKIDLVKEFEDGFIIKTSGKHHNIKIDRIIDDKIILSIDGYYHVAHIEEAVLTGGETGIDISKNIIVAPLSGKVTKIYVAAGQAVNKGERIIAIESMKMENIISSPKNAKVKEIRVGEGSTVSKGDILVILE